MPFPVSPIPFPMPPLVNIAVKNITIVIAFGKFLNF